VFGSIIPCGSFLPASIYIYIYIYIYGSVDIVDEIKEVRNEMHNIMFGVHTGIEKIPRIEVE
jgi:hypothetical protein